ncbi:minor core protein [Baboon orthoreovirus]|uniref:RNA-directed RNA polymerase n=1 Tax=Baboon orthoreovirus TaxID=75888 RepID=G0YZM0_9REOV|nr:minor core protein [Baboon orthoreovirus]AEK86190.1 minor core protein [Baboon orthoreovirus]
MNGIPALSELLSFQRAISGDLDLTDDIFRESAIKLYQYSRSSVYNWLDHVEFAVDFNIPVSLFHHPLHDRYYHIDGANRVRRSQIIDEDDVFVPNCRLTDLLVPHSKFLEYGTLSPKILEQAKNGHGPSRIAATCYLTATNLARQIKMPLEVFIKSLIVSETCELGVDPCNVDKEVSPPLKTNLPLYLIHKISKIIMQNYKSRTPYMFTASDVLWSLSPLMSTAIPPLMVDLTNLAIMRQMNNMDDTLVRHACQMFLHAATSQSYCHYILATKSIFPGCSLNLLYKNSVSGYTLDMDWLEPRHEYKFAVTGIRRLLDEDRNDAPFNEDKYMQIGVKYGCADTINYLMKETRKFNHHDDISMKWVRDCMACTSGNFIVRAPTETVLKEYTHFVKIEKPLTQQDISGYVGEVGLISSMSQPNVRYLHHTWKEATSRVVHDASIYDPLNQAILRSQYITSRGGSGAALRDTLKMIDIDIPEYKGLKIKNSTKIMQAAQIANIPFNLSQRAVLAPLSMGLRNQIQRRARTIMPLNIVQQQISAIHTQVSDYINKHLNLSTTSGSAVTEKVIPLGMYASLPPNQTINVDIKACDSSITYDYFLSVITSALHQGSTGLSESAPYMGVPTTVVRSIDSAGIGSTEVLSGIQHMVQLLALLYKRGFEYKVNDHFSPGNNFTHHTMTFPSGATSTSTEHTANNSTMMDNFLTNWVFDNSDDIEIHKLVHHLTIKRNYICQGDDGILIVNGNNNHKVSSKSIIKLCHLLSKYGQEFGWNYDIDFSGTTEYLKLYFINGCRVPNLSRHSICGKERATADRAEIWPRMIDLIMGIYNNGIHDGIHWRRWLRWCWSLAACTAVVKRKDTNKLVYYPMWAFIYKGLSPIRVFGCPAYSFSVYRPTGDMGMYSLLTILKPYLLSFANTHGYNASVDSAFGPIDFIRLFNDYKVFQGYYAAQLPTQAHHKEDSSDPEIKKQFIKALDDYVFLDSALRARVAEGMNKYAKSGYIGLNKAPTLHDVSKNWYKGALEADNPTMKDVMSLYDSIESAYQHHYNGFSELLNTYLNVEWECDTAIEPVIDIRVPLCAGIDMRNSDHYFKLYSIGPMMESSKKYFQNTLFLQKTLSGLDVNAVDKVLLRLRALNAPSEVITSQLMMLGLSKPAAHTMASKILTMDVKSVQLARVVNLGVPDSWMMTNFDRVINQCVHTYPKDALNKEVNIPPDISWLRPILRMLGAALIYTMPGVGAHVYIRSNRGGMRNMSRKFRQWMAKEMK